MSSTNTQNGFAGNHGYQEDSESGYKLLGHRYYDPATGRFLSRDPIKSGRNWYVYCDSNPLKAIDADCLKPGDKFNSADEAALDFAKIYGPKSDFENQEYGAFIYQNADGSYSYSNPESSGSQRAKGGATRHNGAIDPKMLPPSPPGTRPVGIIHTHPHGRNYPGVKDFVGDDPLNGTASPNDLSYLFNNPKYGFVMWIVNGNTGQIDKFVIPNFFTPGKPKPKYQAPGMKAPAPGSRWKPKPRGAYNGG